MVNGWKERTFLVQETPSTAKVIVPFSTEFSRFDEHQSTYSESHPFSRLGKTSEDIGGIFESTRYSYSGAPEMLKCHKTSALRYLRGPAFAVSFKESPLSSSRWPLPILATSSQMDAWGTTAIARTLPSAPNANVGTALAELKRDGLPSLPGLMAWRNRAKDFRDLGGEYLNVQFGWKPFVSDLRKLADSVTRSEEILAQYRRDSGQNVRRGYRFSLGGAQTVYTPQPDAYPNCGPRSSVYFTPGKGKLMRADSTEESVWFSGCFVYSIPQGRSIPDRMKRYAMEANKLYGIMTPETLWEAAPWSWAVDWVADIGDVLHNVSVMSTTNTVLRYGYVMREYTARRLYTLSGATAYNESSSVYTLPVLSQEFTTTVKQRQKATPFGFGLDLSSFTQDQWAIIAALGISRSPRSLAR